MPSPCIQRSLRHCCARYADMDVTHERTDTHSLRRVSSRQETFSVDRTLPVEPPRMQRSLVQALGTPVVISLWSCDRVRIQSLPIFLRGFTDIPDVERSGFIRFWITRSRRPKQEHRRDVYLARTRRITRSRLFRNRYLARDLSHRVVAHTKNKIQTFHQNCRRALAAAASTMFCCVNFCLFSLITMDSRIPPCATVGLVCGLSCIHRRVAGRVRRKPHEPCNVCDPEMALGHLGTRDYSATRCE